MRTLLVAAALIGVSVAVARAATPSPPVNIVLVHGIFDRGKIFDPMVRMLEKQGCRCLAPSLQPNDCRNGVHALARQLSDRIDACFGRSEPIILIGFSLGGLVTRDYVQTLAAPGRVRGVFLISPPNHGTVWASLAHGGVKQLSLNSTYLQALNRNEQAWQHIPVCTYWTPWDLMIVPSTSSRWPVGDCKEIFCLVHPWMVTNRTLTADITAKIAAIAVGG